jgi:uncharacterized iron-regulated membrane protein
MDGRLGLLLVLANGLSLALIAGSGLAFWWPGRGRALKSLVIRKAAPQRVRLRLWHRSGGVTISIVLLFSAVTGLLLVAPDIAEDGGPAVIRPATARSLTRIDAAVARARAQFPAAQLHDIRFPQADRIEINFSAPARNPRAVHTVKISLSRGELLRSLPAEHNFVLWMKILPLHTGESFGITGRVALLIEALVLSFLTISGPTMWWRARRAKRGGK